MFKIAELLKATNGKLLIGNKDSIIKGISIDSRTVKPNEAFIAIKGANFDGHNYIDEAIAKGAKAVVVKSPGQAVTRSPGRVSFIRVRDTTIALGDIAKFHRDKFKIPIIAVTGSNGKTTTKEMIAWVLSKKSKVLKNIGTKNNHIGLPLTLLNLDDSYRFAVLEIGTNHFGEVGYLAWICDPSIGIITNIGQSHLEFFKNLNGVLREKCTLLKHLNSPAIAVLNTDDRLLKKQVSKDSSPKIILGFGIKDRSDFSASEIAKIPSGLGFLVNNQYRFRLKTFGYYNIYNALTAIAVARLFGMEYRDITFMLSSFEFPDNRLRLQELNNMKFINDTYNSNPVSLGQALDTLENFNVRGRKIFVMGDMLELGCQEELFHRQAGKAVAGICDVFITVGSLSKFAACEAKDSGLNTENIFSCENNVQARDILYKRVSPGPDDIVLVKGSRAMMMEEILK